MSKRDEIINKWEIILPSIILGLLVLSVLYTINKANFWRWVIYILIFALIVVGIILSRRKYKKEKFDDLLSQIKNKHGLEADIKNFISNRGLETGKKDNLWPCERYHFDQKDLDVFREILSEEKGVKVSLSDLKNIIQYYIEKKRKDLIRGGIDTPQQKFSDLNIEGTDLEKLLYRLFEAMGYIVEYTGKRGDQGSDLVLNKGIERIVVQSKRYLDHPCDNGAIQEAVAAKNHYNCSKAWVVVTNFFTPGARTLAQDNDVRLIDKPELQELLLEYLKQSWN